MTRSIPSRRRPRRAPSLAAALLLLLLAPLAAAAQVQSAPPQQPRAQPELSVYLYKLRHQAAGDALNLVTPLLSPRGSVELRAGTNTLVLRDSLASLSRILPVLHAYDHPARDVQVEIWLIRAGGSRVSPDLGSPGIPRELLRSLRDHLQYQTYDLIADSRVLGREGERVTFDLGNDYLVRFRLGTVVSERLRLNEFEVLLEREGEPPASLVRSHLNLWMGRTMVLALAAGEGSPTALMVVVRCQLAPAAAVVERP
jgi:hypothetical protein